MSVKYKELELSDRIMNVVEKALASVETASEIESEELAKLEKLTKVYTMLMSSTRENIKHKLFAHISDLPQELGDSDADADDNTEDSE